MSKGFKVVALAIGGVALVALVAWLAVVYIIVSSIPG